MKIIDEKGRLFGKLSVLDIIAVLVLVILVFFAFLKIINKDISEVSEGSKQKTVLYTVSCENIKGIFRSVKLGDRAGEQKAYFPSEVVDIKIQPIIRVDKKSGREIEDPYLEKALITYKATLPYQSESIKLGKQEIRSGQNFFAESDCYRLNGVIISVEDLE